MVAHWDPIERSTRKVGPINDIQSAGWESNGFDPDTASPFVEGDTSIVQKPVMMQSFWPEDRRLFLPSEQEKKDLSDSHFRMATLLWPSEKECNQMTKRRRLMSDDCSP
jgi:hypothetical protein